MRPISFLLLTLMMLPAFAIVVRHDVADSAYRVNPADYPMIAYLPGEGHGVLINRQWIVTAAHALVWRPVHAVTLKGISRPVEKTFIHPGYKPAPRQLKSGNAEALMKFMATSDDIALIKLKDPVGITPAQIYTGSAEEGQLAEIVARGATGNGVVGEYPHSSHIDLLRRAYSRIISADARWIELRFNAPPEAVALEGMPADGDSGAPIFIKVNGSQQLAGVVSHKLAIGNLSDFQCCLYGQITYQVRISRYADWIDKIIARN